MTYGSVTGNEEDVRVLQTMASLVTPIAVRVAATLRIADRVAAGPRTASELADEVDAHAETLDRVLRHLTASGVFTRDEHGRYAATRLGDVLRDDHASRLRRHLDIDGSVGRADLSFTQLLHSVRTGEAAFPVQFSRTFWEELSAVTGLAASYNLLMGSDVTAEAPDILSAYDWGALGHVVDVGGGNGALLIAMLTQHPTLRGTVVELPGAAESARRAFSDAGLADRADAVASSFFEPLPAGAGGYVLSAIIHNWDDDSARVILQGCAEAAGMKGMVFVIERTGSDNESPDTARDLQQLVYFGGRDRGVSAITGLASDVGLKLTHVYPAGVNKVLELIAG